MLQSRVLVESCDCPCHACAASKLLKEEFAGQEFYVVTGAGVWNTFRIRFKELSQAVRFRLLFE